MMPKEDEFFLSFSDIKGIMKKKAMVIIAVGFLCAVVGFIYTATRPVVYEAKALFREKGSSSSVAASGLAAFFGKGGDDASPECIMLSRRVTEDVIKQLKLNVIVDHGEDKSLVMCLKKNLYLEWAHLSRRYFPPHEKKGMAATFFEEKAPSLSCTLHAFAGDAFYRELVVKPLKDERFQLIDNESQQDLGTYKLREKISLDNCSFTIEGPLVAEANILLLSTLKVADALDGKIVIKRDKLQPKFMNISLIHKDPQMAAAIVNQLIASYKSFLNEEHTQLVLGQLSYLQERQGQLVGQFEGLMSEHANYMQSVIRQHGFAGLDRKSGALEKQYDQYKLRLLQIEAERSMLDSHEGVEFLAQNAIGQKLFMEKQGLVQDKELLQLALKEQQAGQESALEESWANYSAELEEIAHEQAMIGELKSRLDKPVELAEYWESIKNLQFTQKFGVRPFFDENRVTEWLAHLNKYLDNLSEHLLMRQKLMTERLFYKKHPTTLFQGMDLQSAKKIQSVLIDSIQMCDSRRHKLNLAHERLLDKQTDLASLGSALEADPLVADHLKEATEINCRLQDSYNNSTKDITRLKSRLDVTRAFLQMHVKETSAVVNLQKKIHEEELVQLKIATLELLNQKIAVLEQQLWSLQRSQNKKLGRESEIIQREIEKTNMRASVLPLQWMRQEKLEMFKTMNVNIIGELVKAIETKNISQHLEKMESSAIDMARAPLMPKKPRLMLFSALGLVLGLIGAAVVSIIRELLAGLPVTEENLRLLGGTVFGKLAGDERDMRALRSAIALLKQRPCDKRVIIVAGSFSESFDAMAHLLAIQGERVLLIDTTWFNEKEQELSSDFELYIRGERFMRPTPIAMDAGYDRLTTGRYSSFAAELTNSMRWEELVASFESIYDRVLIVMPLPYTHLLAMSGVQLRVVKEARLSELKPLWDSVGGFFLV